MTTNTKLYPTDTRRSPFRIRDVHASTLTELWLVSTVGSIFAIRFYLHLTGYPEVGGDELHIAHIVWGGLGMIIAIGMLLLFASSVWKPIAAVTAGIGFGTFVDELGKFITQENDYFYRPALGLIYLVCIVLFIIARVLDESRKPFKGDHLVYALDGVERLMIDRLGHDRKLESLRHLEHSGDDSELTQSMRRALEAAEPEDEVHPTRIMSMQRFLRRKYREWLESSRLKVIVVVLIGVRLIQLGGALLIGVLDDAFIFTEGLTFAEWMTVGAALLTLLITAYGIVRFLQGDRRHAYQAIGVGLLASLLFGQFFTFVTDQFVAFAVLLVDLILLMLVRFAESTERYDEQIDDPGRVAD